MYPRKIVGGYKIDKNLIKKLTGVFIYCQIYLFIDKLWAGASSLERGVESALIHSDEPTPASSRTHFTPSKEGNLKQIPENITPLHPA